MFNREEEMKAPVVEWLEGRGFTEFRRVLFRSWPHELVGKVGVDLIEERCEQRYLEGPVASWGAPPKVKEKLLQPLPRWYPVFRPHHVAVELKLENRIEAFNQASSYYEDVHYAYVGLPPGPASRCHEQRDFETFLAPCYGIGLLSVTPDGVEVLVEPKRSNMHRVTTVVHVAEKAWRYWYQRRRAEEGE